MWIVATKSVVSSMSFKNQDLSAITQAVAAFCLK